MSHALRPSPPSPSPRPAAPRHLSAPLDRPAASSTAAVDGPKRALDVGVALVALAVLAVPMLGIAALIRLDTPGPVFFRQERMGRGERPFRVYKFRTMVHGAEACGPSVTGAVDPRVTRVGRLLRWFKADELPQLLNILRGDMSVVGPRPLVSAQVADYTPLERQVFRVRPGLTDWASIQLHNEAELLRDVSCPLEEHDRRIRPMKVALQLHYIAHRSLRTDLQIIAETVRVLVYTRLLRRTVDVRVPDVPPLPPPSDARPRADAPVAWAVAHEPGVRAPDDAYPASLPRRAPGLVGGP